MNKNLMRRLGFGDAIACVEQGLCPTCKEKVDTGEFTSSLDWKEFEISGMCKKCQDKTFGEYE